MMLNINWDLVWAMVLVSGPIGLAILAAFGLLNGRRQLAYGPRVSLALLAVVFFSLVAVSGVLVSSGAHPAAPTSTSPTNR